MPTLGFNRKSTAFAPASAHSVGIEVELEDGDIPSAPRSCDLWTVKGDDSLRNGQELVTTMPIWKVNLEECYEQFDQILARARGTPTASWRCSTHVHLDIRDLNLEQLQAMMCAVALTDTILAKLHDREGSNFCVPYRSWDPVRQAFQKYTSAGLFRYGDLGTIEFRVFRGVTTSADLRHIVDTVHAYRVVAETPERVFAALRTRQYSAVYDVVRDIIQPATPLGQEYIKQQILNGFPAAVAITKLTSQLESQLRTINEQQRDPSE